MQRWFMQKLCISMMGCGLMACGTDASGGTSLQPGDSEDGSALAAANLRFVTCDGQPFMRPAAEDTPHLGHRLARHVAQDSLVWPGMPTLLGGLFSHDGHRPVARATVRVAVDTCNGWQTAGLGQTDGGGHAQVTYVGNQVGRFNVVAVLQNDGSLAMSQLHVLPAGTHVVVFDIDGTLTTDNGQYVHALFDPGYVPQAFPNAAAATHAWAAKGYIVLYLTGRPELSMTMTRNWLDTQGFAAGPLHLADAAWELLPTDASVGTFKRQYLQHLQHDLGYVFDWAYGNEPTDVFAYEGIGMDAKHIFTLGPKAGMQGTGALPTGYIDNMAFIAQQPSAQQPFAADNL